MKKNQFLSLLVALLVAIPSFGQVVATRGNCNPALLISNYQIFLQKTGPFTKVQLGAPVDVKVASAATLGGFILRAEKTTDMLQGTSKQAIKLMPKSATGVGKIVGKATAGLAGGADGIYYIDYDEIPNIIKAIEKMKSLSGDVPTLYTSYSYLCRGGFQFSSTYLVAAKQALWVGQISGTGEMPLADFFDEMVKGLEEVKKHFANFK